MRWQECLLWHATVHFVAAVTFTNPTGWVGSHVPLPTESLEALPACMCDDVNNECGTAPDAGIFDEPLLGLISPQDARKIKFELPNGTLVTANVLESIPSLLDNITAPLSSALPAPSAVLPRHDGRYWLGSLGSKGMMPLAESDFKFFRIVKDYGAVGDGSTDDTAAINKAASDGNVCGNNCGSTMVHGSVVYFPPGIYLVSSPIIQYYHQQFIGDTVTPPSPHSEGHPYSGFRFSEPSASGLYANASNSHGPRQTGAARWSSSSQLILFRNETQAVADEYLKSAGVKLRNCRKRTRNIKDRKAYSQGKSDGHKFDVRSRIKRIKDVTTSVIDSE